MLNSFLEILLLFLLAVKPSVGGLVCLWAVGLEFCDLKSSGWLPRGFFAGHSLRMRAEVIFAPVILELMGFGLDKVHRTYVASKFAYCDPNRSIWEGEDFGIGRRRCEGVVHSAEKR